MSENPALDPDGVGEITEGGEATEGGGGEATEGTEVTVGSAGPEVTDGSHAADGNDERSDASDDDGRAQGAVGCLLAVAGVTVAGVFALPRASYSIDGGFEAHARDWSVILVELPLILLAGLLVPPMTWAAATRWLRPWAAFLVCAAVVALGLWGVAAVWHPRQGPDPGYGPGM
ncbi:hypothetical protein [Streptomyces aureus]|uniref:hypothetical protein n=1 Tax=Streptomyces aureus TaxID=193461 RepID=UPI000B18710B|nr:hypothetical protein [Streptomyces aureus]